MSREKESLQSANSNNADNEKPKWTVSRRDLLRITLASGIGAAAGVLDGYLNSLGYTDSEYAPFSTDRYSYPSTHDVIRSSEVLDPVTKRLATSIENIAQSDFYANDIRDSLYIRTDCLEPHEIPPQYIQHSKELNESESSKGSLKKVYKYIAMSHYENKKDGKFYTVLLMSEDMEQWDRVKEEPLEKNASMPHLYFLENNDGILMAHEKMGHGNKVEIRWYPELDALLKNENYKTLPNDHFVKDSQNEGTPVIRKAKRNPTGTHKQDELYKDLEIDLTFHYKQDDETPDQQGEIQVTKWGEDVHDLHNSSEVTDALRAFGVGGGIGDRAFFSFEGKDYEILEGCFEDQEFGMWRLFLIDKTNNQIVLLDIWSKEGRKNLANPWMAEYTTANGEKRLGISFVEFSRSAARTSLALLPTS